MKVGSPTYHFESLGSTNDYAHSLLSKQAVIEGTVVSTGFQTSGRGQHNKSWNVSAGDNITMSVIMKPTWLKIKDQFALNVITSLAVHRFLSKYVKGVSIKWPNDIYVSDKKITGILIKNQLQGSTIRNSIIGIGININQKTWPPEVINATSLYLEKRQEYDVALLRSQLCESLQLEYSNFQKDTSLGWSTYRSNLFRKGQATAFQYDGKTDKGVIEDVGYDGRLVVRFGDTQKLFSHGEIQMII